MTVREKLVNIANNNNKTMTASLQGQLRAAGLPHHFTMHSFREGASLSRSMNGTAIEESMEIGGWKTELLSAYGLWLSGHRCSDTPLLMSADSTRQKAV